MDTHTIMRGKLADLVQVARFKYNAAKKTDDIELIRNARQHLELLELTLKHFDAKSQMEST